MAAARGSVGAAAQQVIDHAGGTTQEEVAAQEAKRAEQAESRRVILKQVLTDAAKARIANIALVKPAKARAIEDRFIAMAQRGQIKSKVSEEEVKRLLETLSKSDETTKVTMKRRVVHEEDALDDDEDDF